MFRKLSTDFLPAGPWGEIRWYLLPSEMSFPAPYLLGHISCGRLAFPVAAAADLLDVPSTASPAGCRAVLAC